MISSGDGGGGSLVVRAAVVKAMVMASKTHIMICFATIKWIGFPSRNSKKVRRFCIFSWIELGLDPDVW